MDDYKKKEDDVVVDGKPYEDDVMVTAVAADGTTGATGGEVAGPPIPAGHSRFYCSKCRTVSNLSFYGPIHILVQLLLVIERIIHTL
jgi:hypothetical protein